jgi:hypothetical protein
MTSFKGRKAELPESVLKIVRRKPMSREPRVGDQVILRIAFSTSISLSESSLTVSDVKARGAACLD